MSSRGPSSYVHALAAFLDPGRCTDANLMETTLTVCLVTEGETGRASTRGELEGLIATRPRREREAEAKERFAYTQRGLNQPAVPYRGREERSQGAHIKKRREQTHKSSHTRSRGIERQMIVIQRTIFLCSRMSGLPRPGKVY